jgi:hypothetical protein
MLRRLLVLSVMLLLPFVFTQAQSNPPTVSQVLLSSAIQSNGQFPSVYTYNGPQPVDLGSNCANPCPLAVRSNFTTTANTRSIFGLTSTLNASVATALSVIPVASPASGVIFKNDASTGLPLPASSTLGPIFTERGETIGKHHFYVGISNQDFHFKSYNGQDTKGLQLMDLGQNASNVTAGGHGVTSFPVTYNINMDVKLSQDVAFLTYGVTDRLDVSVGLPIVHASVSANTYNGQIFVGNGLGNVSSGINPAYGNGGGAANCWCVDTFTPGQAPDSQGGSGFGLTLANINSAGRAKTGFGDLIIRAKGSVIERKSLVVALGVDLRLPTGDSQNFLGTGTTSVKPFAAVSLYTKPLTDWLVLSPHINVGWQISGKSNLGGLFLPSEVATSPTAFGAPLTPQKDYLPDVFSWAIGTEVGLGRRNTVVLDFLGNQIGWINGIPNMVTDNVANVPAPNTATNVTATGLISGGRTSFGQYSGAFGYKARLVGNLVGTFNMLVRFDNNGLTARATPLFGLAYTF